VPETGKSFTAGEARAIGQEIGIGWAASPFDVEQFRIGMNVELEHGPVHVLQLPAAGRPPGRLGDSIPDVSTSRASSDRASRDCPPREDR
jgi:hypothetical protein